LVFVLVKLDVLVLVFVLVAVLVRVLVADSVGVLLAVFVVVRVGVAVLVLLKDIEGVGLEHGDGVLVVPRLFEIVLVRVELLEIENDGVGDMSGLLLTVAVLVLVLLLLKVLVLLCVILGVRVALSNGVPVLDAVTLDVGVLVGVDV
jgi:hypothetical protein